LCERERERERERVFIKKIGVFGLVQLHSR
jgi:hypothetical protein